MPSNAAPLQEQVAEQPAPVPTTTISIDGQRYTMPADKAALAAERFPNVKILSDADIQAAQNEEHYGDTAGKIGAAGLGALRTATFGGSDWAMRKASSAALGIPEEEAAARLKALSETNPKSTLAGELAGVALPGPMGVLGKVAGKGGELVGGGIAKAIGEKASSGLLGRALAGAGEMGTRGAIEGAAFGAGAGVTQSALDGDPELSAEKILAHAREGATLGLLLGSAAGTVGGVAKGLRGLTAKKLFASAEDSAAEEIGAASTEAPKTIGDRVQSFAEGRAFKSSGAMLKDFRKATFRLGDEAPEIIGRDMLDEMPAAVGKPFAAMTEADIAHGAQKLERSFGEKIGAAWKEVDGAGELAQKGALEARAAIGKAVTDDILKPLEDKLGGGPIADSVKATFMDFIEKSEPKAGKPLTFQRLRQLRTDLGDVVYRAADPRNPSPAVDALRDFYSVMGRETMSFGAKVADESGIQGWRSALEEANRKFANFKLVAKTAADKESRAAANRILSLTDTGTGVGAGLGALASGHVGGVMAGVAGLGSAIAHKFVRERGSFIAADALDRLSRSEWLGKAVASTDKALESGVAKAITEKAPRVARETAQAVGGKARQAAIVAEIHAVQHAASNPEILQQHVAQTIQGVNDIAPATAIAIGAQEVRQVAYLKDQAPKPFSNGGTLTPQLEATRYSPIELEAWRRKRDAVMHPLKLLEELQDGNLSRDTVDAVKATAPRIFQQAQTLAFQKLTDLKHPLPFDKQLQLSLLFGVDVLDCMRPDFIALMQGSAAQTKQASAEQLAAPSQIPLPRRQANVAAPYTSELARISSGRIGSR